MKPTTSQGPFPYRVTEATQNRELSAAMGRSFEQYSGIHPAENELYTQFKYTRHELEVFFDQGLNRQQKERIAKETEKLKGK